MRRSLGKATILAAAIVAVAICAGSALGVADAAPATVVVEDFLGYAIGEERRYVIAPDNAMRRGESATWGIRLDRVEDAPGRMVGVFELTHVESRWGVQLSGSIMVEWHYRAEVRINEFGFPEDVNLSMYEQHTGESPWRGALRSADYSLQGDGYVKTVRVPNQEWEFEFGVATDDSLDLDVPAGLFLLRPQAAGIDFFMNPALVGFAIPDLLPEEWKQRRLFFRPTYPVRYPGGSYATFERNKMAAIRRYYVKRTLEAKDYQQLEIGGRTLNVRQIDVSGAMRSVYVDEFGRVVRVDLDPDGITNRNRHIRMLFPSEY